MEIILKVNSLIINNYCNFAYLLNKIRVKFITLPYEEIRLRFATRFRSV